MHEVDNEDRRGWARAALVAFGEQTGQVGYVFTDPDHLGEIAGDLICNLLHLADAAGLDPEALIDRARDHYDIEREDDEDDEPEVETVGLIGPDGVHHVSESRDGRLGPCSCGVDHSAREDDEPEEGSDE